MTRRAAASGLVLGLAAIVLGAFLPWMHSGSATRNSYRAAGVARRVLHVAGWLGAGLRVWPFIPLAAAVAVALLAMGWTRSAGVLGTLLCAGCAAVTVGTLSLAGNTAVSPAALGPSVTLIGAGLGLVSSTLLLGRQRHRPRSTA